MCRSTWGVILDAWVSLPIAPTPLDSVAEIARSDPLAVQVSEEGPEDLAALLHAAATEVPAAVGDERAQRNRGQLEKRAHARPSEKPLEGTQMVPEESQRLRSIPTFALQVIEKARGAFLEGPASEQARPAVEEAWEDKTQPVSIGTRTCDTKVPRSRRDSRGRLFTHSARNASI